VTAPTNPQAGGPELAGVQRSALIAAVAGIAAFVVLALVLPAVSAAPKPGDPNSTGLVTQLLASYTTGFVFWLSLPLGSMVLLMIQYLVFSRWGILLRRVLEASSRTLPLLAVLFVPVAVAFYLPDTSTYWWARPLAPQAGLVAATGEAEAKAINEKAGREVLGKQVTLHELQEKVERYLNPTRAVIGAAVYFVIWLGLMFVLNSLSAKAEKQPDSGARSTLSKVAGPGLIVYALTVTFAATDWVMSMEYTWASTMFPVIFAVNQILTAYAFAVAVTLLLFRDTLAKKIPHGYQIHLGSFLLAFTLFWTYTSFSQFLLVWVGNLPEEITFFLKRSQAGWQWVSGALAVFHFGVPFALLLFRDVKSDAKALSGVAILLLVMCFVDVLWWIEPVFGHEGQSLYWLLDVAAVVGIGGLWLWFFLYQIQGRALLPTYEKAALEDHHD
jgi:hypothetical protein